MRSYKYYLNENYNASTSQKIQFVRTVPVKSSVESDKLKELMDLAIDNLYTIYFIADKELPKLNNDSPVLLYSHRDGRGVIEKNNIKPETVYNKSQEVLKSMYKKQWHELLGDKWYLPKTVTDINKISELKFPIIAKPSEGHSGLGIMKFDTLEKCMKEVNKSGNELDTFCEMVKDVVTEYRIILVKDKIFLVHERIPIIENNKTIATKKPDEELSFLYVEQDLSKQCYDIANIVKDFRRYINLDFYALDVLLDKNGKYWLLESNGGIGMGANTLCRAYEAIYKDFYKTDLPKDKQEIVDKVCKEYFEEISKTYPKEIAKSKNARVY